jgi:hypothetical protein
VTRALRAVTLIAAVAFVSTVVVLDPGGKNADAASKAVHVLPASPVATVSPKPDQYPMGLPQPASAPTCVAGNANLHSDSVGCVYACAGVNRVKLANAGNATCVFTTPVPTATATPTPTATSTP